MFTRSKNLPKCKFILKNNIKKLIVFSPIFVADKKIILYYNFWVLLIVVSIDFIINVAYIVVTVSF